MNKSKSGWNELLDLCLSIEDKKTLDNLFELLFTSEERKDFTTRLLIIKKLLTGESTQRQIAKDLNVSIAKITRGSNELKRINPKFLSALKNKIV